MKFKKLLLVCCAAATLMSPAMRPNAATESPLWKDDIVSALQAAKEKQSLVLVDFYAPWCYSCYFMAQNVLNQPEFRTLRGNIEPVKIDVDSPEGMRLKQEWAVHFLPTYILLSSNREEVGRIIGEQVRTDFYTQLRSILARHSTLADLEAQFRTAGSAQTPALARQILEIRQARGETAEGLKFFADLPKNIQVAVLKTTAGALVVKRLRLAQAAAAKDAFACLRYGMDLLKTPLDCALPYDAEHINDCVKGGPAGFARPVYQSEEAQLNALLKKRILGPVRNRCADFRSPISFAAELYTLTGRKPDADKLLAWGISTLRKEIGTDFSKDRSKTDNLRAFLELAGRDKELEELYPKLTAFYPDEYVYYYRFGKFLLQHDRAQDALVQFEKAEPKAYGANKLNVVEQKSRALAKLGRKEEALNILKAALSDHPDDFPDQIASLRRFQTELRP